MTDNFTDIDDGDGRYASRQRINRKVVDIPTASGNSVSTTVIMNGKIGRIILDPSRVTANGSVGATSGSMKLTMDIEDSSSIEYPYCDTLAALDFRTSSNTPLNFQTSEGGNMNADGGATSGLALTVTAPASSTTGGKTIDEPSAWNGLVCGAVTFTFAVAAGAYTGGSIRLVLIYE